MPLMPWDKISWKLMITVIIGTALIMFVIGLLKNCFKGY